MLDIYPNGSMTWEQRRYVVELRSLLCFKLNCDVVPISY